MGEIHLAGELECATEEEAQVVRLLLPEHLRLTRAEVGCVSFEVVATDNPRIWSVEERFADQAVFESHQRRVASSEWGRATAGITRRYSVTGLAG
ncbi:quinol monooxygenase YgiN [Microbacterium sp. SLBN-154]|nr:quinol monooxygenase YgiN [Microbacterium sp. SLBN-154]